jgi:RHS repeat-associated protein
MAAQRGPSPILTLIVSMPNRARAATLNMMAILATVETKLFALVRPSSPQDNWTVVLTPVSADFKDYVGLDYHQPSKKLLLSANSPTGQPNNFELIAADGTRSVFSNVAELSGGLLIATTRDEDQGMSRGGFSAGELLSSTGVSGVIARVNASGASLQNPWVTLPDETGIGGLYVDRTGVFGGDLIVVTTLGGVWRVNSVGVATKLASLGTRLAGVTVVPDDPDRYGPWAGKILAGAKDQSTIYAVDTLGQTSTLQLDIHPQDIDIVPAQENFYAVDTSARKVWGASDGAFAGVIGDILVAQQSPGIIMRLRWNGLQFVVSEIAEGAEFKQVAFSPAGINPIPTVKQLYDKIAVVRHSVTLLNSGRVEGSLWQLMPEDVTLDGTDTITSDLLVPGTPVVLHSAPASYAGTLLGTENPEPSDYSITIKGSAELRHVVARTNPVQLENVSPPPTPTGTRDVTINHAGQQIGDPGTLRNLSISGNGGTIVVPPGTYGDFTVSGRNVLVFGVQNSPAPTIYNLEELSLSGSSELQLAGPIVLTVKNRVTITGSTLGAADNPRRLLLKIATGLADANDALKVSGNAVLYGIVRAPQGTITIEGSGRVRGTVSCNYLFVNGNGILQITESDVPPPPVNRPPTVDAGGDQSITLPTNTVSLNGIASDDGLPQGSTLQLAWSKVSGPGPVVFSNATNAIGTTTFTTAGTYILKFTASDGQLSSSDTLTVVVITSNQPPTVDAGPDQTIELPDPVALRGVVTDDALPHGSTVSSTWSFVSGPGPVVFTNPNAAVTSASFTNPGTYTLRLTATDTEFTVSDDMMVTVLLNQPPVVNAGPDQEITLPGTAILNGTASDDGLPRGSILGTFWTLVSGPNAVVFNDAFELSTLSTFTVAGTYVLRLTASDSKLSVSDEMSIVVKPKTFTERTYTLDPDFDEGNLINVSHAISNQIQLDDTAKNFDFIWVAVSTKGTLVKINTDTGAVIGEYFTSPAGQPKDPSRTTVDLNGSVWATNREGNSVVHVGLVENGQCVDRNGNGVIDTSNAYGDLRAWTNAGGANTNGGVSTAVDECIIHYTKVNSFGTRHVSVNKDNDIWVSGISGRRFDLLDGKTGQIKRAEPTVGYGGYGGLMDKAGVIWSSNPLLRWDPVLPLTGPNGVNWRGYSTPSYGLCTDSNGNVWNTSYGNGEIRKFAPDGTLIGTFSQGFAYAQGCVVGKNDDVWVAHSLNGSSVGHLRNNGTYVGTVPVGTGPTGVAVDSTGKIWATNYYSRTVSRINPQAGPFAADGVTRVGAVDFTTQDLGGNLYNYSDMTGSTLTGVPSTGTWSTIFDSHVVGAEWGRIGWTSRICGDSSLIVTVASSTNGTSFGPAETVTNGADPSVANGRYLRINVAFKRAASGESPVLYDLSVGTSGYTLPVVPNAGPSVFAGSDLTVTLPDAAKLRGLSCDDGFPRGSTLALSWTKVSGPGEVAFNPTNATVSDATFTLAGAYVLRLTASDSEQTVSDDVTVTVLPANMAPIVNAGANQTITLPNTANLSGTASDDGFPVGSTLTTFWSQLSGPGVVTFDNPNTLTTRAIFPAAGSYTLRLAANDTHRIGTDDVVITVNASPALTGATLSLAAANVGPYVTGTLQPLRATLRNSAGNPLANYGVEFTVTGPNATTGSAVTNASGIATFTYTGTNPGTDSVSARVRSTATININSNVVPMTWTLTPQSPPVTQGWIGGPANGATITGSVPITVGAGVTLTQATVEYWPASDPAAITTLATGVQGSPGATLAVLDTTLISNGNYVIRVTATDSSGQEQISQVMITVVGENKPGRLTFSVTDLNVPVSGLPITIARKYDSLERTQVGDFGHGWSLAVSGPRLEISPDNDVTITEPGTGRRVTFQFTPLSFGFPFSFFYQPTYTPEPGVFGKLTSNGCGLLINSGSGVICFLSVDPTYSPTAFAYTDPYGRVYTMTADGQLNSIKDLNGNLLTFSANGITSSAGGLNVPFVRDAQSRITQITAPDGKEFHYNYDGAGNLSTVQLPGITTPVTYTYDTSHFFLSAVDSRGNTEALTYHPDGRLASITDAVGNTTSFAYNLAQNKTITTYPDAGVVTTLYNASGLVLSKTDALNRTTTYTYDGNRNKLTETNALGQVSTYTYDANGHQTSSTDFQGRAVRTTYNPYGGPITYTDQLGNVRTVAYDARFTPTMISDSVGIVAKYTVDDQGNPITFVNANGGVTRYTYNAFGNLLTRTDPLGRTITSTYDEMGRVLTTTNPRGGVTRHTYNGLGDPLTTIDPLGQTTRYEYDANNNRTAVVDAAGRRTEFTYDFANRLTMVTFPDASTMSYTYDFRNKRLTETDQDGHKTTHQYDKAGQLVKTIYPDGTQITRIFDAIGRVTSLTDERGKVTTYEYDPSCGCQDRVTKITDALGHIITNNFDAAGRHTSFVDSSNNETAYTYDARGRLTQTTYPDNTVTKQTFDGLGQTLTKTDQANRVTRFNYDEVGNLNSVIDALNQTSSNSYDTVNNLLSTTDALGRTTLFEYDALNRLIKRTLPLGMAELYTYDQVGNRVTRADFRGKQTAYDYDSMNRLTRKLPDASLGEPAITYSYTPGGQRASMTDTSGTSAYTYDTRHRLLSKQTPQGSLTYTFDPAGNLASMVSSNLNGLSVSYTYDAVNGLETVADGSITPGTTTYTYDVNGNVTNYVMPNGVRSAYTYDTLNRPTSLTISKTATLASETNTFDPTGRQLSQIELSGRTINYSYDALYRLTGETVMGDPNSSTNGSLNNTYDPVGNRLNRTSTISALTSITLAYDANNRLTVDAYDANGNTRNAGGASYSYDFENRLKTLNQGSVSYVYDGDGNRVAKTVGGVTTRYLIDDLNPTGYSQVVEELVDGNVQRVYSHGHKLLSQRRFDGTSWTTSFYGYDGQNNVRLLTNNAGAVTDNYTYDAFGNRLASVGITPNNYLYNGEQLDADLGLYYLRARNYAPNRGRFLTMDPDSGDIARPASLHKYLYADADPVNNSDPSGMSAAVEYVLIQRKVVDVTIPAMIALGIAIACVFSRTADTILLKTEPVPGNPCVGKYPRCEKVYPEYTRCDSLGGNYSFGSAGGAFNRVQLEMRAAGYDTKGLRMEGGQPATGGPCAGTPGARHYNVRQGSAQRASIGECTCCEDNGGTTYPGLKTKCAILSRYY